MYRRHVSVGSIPTIHVLKEKLEKNITTFWFKKGCFHLELFKSSRVPHLENISPVLGLRFGKFFRCCDTINYKTDTLIAQHAG